MTEWQHFVKITILLMLTSSIIVGSVMLADNGVTAYDSNKEKVTISNQVIAEYNDHIARRFPYNTIVSPLEIAYIATYYGIDTYYLEAFVIPSYNTHQIEINTGTVGLDDMVDAYAHLEFLESHGSQTTNPWVMYSKYKVTYDRDENTGEISNLYFEGVER